MTTFPDLQVLKDDIVRQGNRMVYRATLTARTADSAARGRRSVSVPWTIAEDGPIAESRGHFNAAEY